MLRNLACSLFLTESDIHSDQRDANPNAPMPPKTQGRIITTLQKAKEVRPLVEKCITIARRSLSAQVEADKYDTDGERHSTQWNEWRQSDQWKQWNQAITPVLTARRRVVQLLGGKKEQDSIASQAVQVLFDEIAPRFENRPGGYTRILRLAKPRLGDGGTRALLEFVGKHDRISDRSEAPAFDEEQESAEEAQEEAPEEQAAEAKNEANASEENMQQEEDQSDE